MNYIMAFSAIMSCFAAETAMADDAPKNYIAGKWTFPSGERAVQLFPDKAIKERVQGQATVECIIQRDGKISSCTVISETPEDYGFGAATAELFVRYAHVNPKSVNGGLKGGELKKFTYRWVLM
ncbi:MAG TPA: TonB family protein [Asticcacaulis sp.]|nr:TonB family protein [Asticcacaulis sp.]